jgi:hypothetical protein
MDTRGTSNLRPSGLSDRTRFLSRYYSALAVLYQQLSRLVLPRLFAPDRFVCSHDGREYRPGGHGSPLYCYVFGTHNSALLAVLVGLFSPFCYEWLVFRFHVAQSPSRLNLLFPAALSPAVLTSVDTAHHHSLPPSALPLLSFTPHPLHLFLLSLLLPLPFSENHLLD